MPRSEIELGADAQQIWQAGVAAVQPERLIKQHVRVEGNWLTVGEEVLDLRSLGRIAIVGAGKAAGAMALALESVLGASVLEKKNVTGWVNVPADCVVPTQCVHLHAARPPGVNEPRPEGVEGTERILELVSSLGPDDACLCVLTGGGSALLPAPVPGISLEEKIQVTRLLSAAGANIEQLNTVRRQLSLVKGGGLARACRARVLITLVISDVLGDPLDAIASGPTVPSSNTAADALAVLRDLHLTREPTIQAVVRYLEQRSQLRGEERKVREVKHIVLGNNALAVDAAGAEATRLGYSPALLAANAPEGLAEDVGRHLAHIALRMHDVPGADCLVSGGETTVRLVEEALRGKGGRNQQLALAALALLGDCRGIALLSAGTDGEDGPTDAAGALVTENVVRAAREQQLEPHDYLARNDAYHFFQRAGGLFITGPTSTNVCDLRVITVQRD